MKLQPNYMGRFKSIVYTQSGLISNGPTCITSEIFGIFLATTSEVFQVNPNWTEISIIDLTVTT